MFYPNLEYVLLGDDSQRDPFLYERVAKIFPQNIKAIYIRQTGRRKRTKTRSALKNIQSLGVETCYFKSSEKAIEHSKSIGIL